MKKFKDISGQRFGRLVALNIVRRENGKTYWLFQCDCGNKVIIPQSYVSTGDTKSCGCYRKEVAKGNNNSTKHNKTQTRLYSIWSGIKQRCYNKNKIAYEYYGARGIGVCDEWKSDFMAFYVWALKNGYKDDLTIDRIDVNGNYKPNNCRWATIKEQNNNMRNNHWINYKGQKLTMSQFAEKYGIPYQIMKNRIRYNWSIDRIISTPFKLHTVK